MSIIKYYRRAISVAEIRQTLHAHSIRVRVPWIAKILSILVGFIAKTSVSILTLLVRLIATLKVKGLLSKGPVKDKGLLFRHINMGKLAGRQISPIILGLAYVF